MLSKNLFVNWKLNDIFEKKFHQLTALERFENTILLQSSPY